MHYVRTRRNGAPIATRKSGDVWDRVDKGGPGGCWLWLGSTKRGGYGQITRDKIHWVAHRYIYTLLVGPIPEGMELDHLCRVRHCVNPDHLEPVGRRENIARSSHPAGHALRTDTCHKGHPLSGDNVYRRPSQPNARSCRACRKERRNRERRASRPVDAKAMK